MGDVMSESQADHEKTQNPGSTSETESTVEPKAETDPDRELTDEEYLDLLVRRRKDEGVTYEDLAHMAGWLYSVEISAADLEAVDTGARYPQVSDKLRTLMEDRESSSDQRTLDRRRRLLEKRTFDPTSNLQLQYERYKERRAKWYPDRRELSFDEFKTAAQRWDREYYDAWSEGNAQENDWGTIDELEELLCVPPASRMLSASVAAMRETQPSREQTAEESATEKAPSDPPSTDSGSTMHPVTDQSINHKTSSTIMNTNDLLKGLRAQRNAIDASLESIDESLEQYRQMRETLDEAIAILEGNTLEPLLEVVKQLHGLQGDATDSDLPEHLENKLSSDQDEEDDHGVKPEQEDYPSDQMSHTKHFEASA